VVMVNIHDCLWFGEKAINELPYDERLKFLRKLFPDAPDRPEDPKRSAIIITPTWVVKSKDQLMKALEAARRYPGSEGAMLKAADSKYVPSPVRTVEWAKYKVVLEIAVRVIGRMRKALPFASIGMKAPKEKITGDEAVKLYKRLQEKSKTWIFRCAILDDGKLLPLDSKKKFAPRDFEVMWNPELVRPRWQGLESPLLWEMDPKIPERKVGDYAFANTYGMAFDDPPKIGDIITVMPVQILQFRGDDNKMHLSWMFPRVKERRPERKKPDTLDEIRELIAK